MNERSRTGKAEERFASYWSANLQKQMVQYDYRTVNGVLFSCVAVDLDAARARRDTWLKNGQIDEETLLHRLSKLQQQV